MTVHLVRVALVVCLSLLIMIQGCSSSHKIDIQKAGVSSNRWSPSLADKPAANHPAFELVSDGQPRATIVIAADALDSNKQAAEFLQEYVRKISGATLPIVNDSQSVEGPVVLIGRSKLTESLDLDIPTGFTRSLNEEGYIIRTAGDRLILAGNDHRPVPAYNGSQLAVVEVLQRLGCRWFYPGELGETYPTSADVSLPHIDVTVKPDNAVRGFWYGTSAELRRNQQLRGEMDRWYVLNRYLPYGSVIPSAGDGSIMRPFRKYEQREVDGKKVRVNTMFEQHPEYFALKADGTRDAEYLCLSNPDVLQVTLAYAREYFQQNPNALAFPISPPDGAPTCECPDCKARNNYFMQKEPADVRIQDISGGFYWYMNEVARHLEKEYPDKRVTSLAYSGRTRPPENLELHHNITVRTALLAHARHHRYDWPTWHTQEIVQILRRWAKQSPEMIDRPYFPTMQFHCHVYQPMLESSAFNIRFVKDLGFRGMEWESKVSFFIEGASNYVRGQLLWNTQTDVDALLEDYYTRAFGGAAKRLAKFDRDVEKLLTQNMIDHHEEERLHEIYPYEKVMKITADADDIHKLAAGDSAAVQKRVSFFIDVMKHFRAYAQMREAEKHLDFVGAAGYAQQMLDIEAKVNAVSLAYLDDFSRVMDSRAVYGELGANATAHGKLKQYRAKAEMLDGTRGKLVAALPITWQFKADPHDDGVIHQWYSPIKPGDKSWRPMRTTESWEIQGMQDKQARGYNGFGWYQTQVEIPADATGKPLKLFLGGFNNQAWVWVNGRLAGATPYHEYWERWKYHGEVDITSFIQPGQVNHIAIRIHNDQDAGGIFRRCFIYSPNPQTTEAKAASAD